MRKPNDGRCARCIAHTFIIPPNNEKGNRKKMYCIVYNRFCQGTAQKCKAPPQGLTELSGAKE